jgi:hypothetical protein
VSSVAEQLRRETLDADLALSPEARLERALALGEADAALHAAAQGLDLETARRLLHGRRAQGRRPSACAAER